MKRKTLVSLSITMTLLFVFVIVANAFTFGNVDGVWGLIDGGGGASCDRWATGPTTENPNGGSVSTSNSDPNIQTPPNTDWNQVRYGTDGNNGPCLSWANQSGLAFNGRDAVVTPPVYEEEVPFPLGKFCHVNNPINASNSFGTVPLTVTMSNIACDSYAIPPFPPSTLTFTYTVNLDETPNSGTCAYPSDPGNPCADAVTFVTPTNQTFRCNYTGGVYKDFTVAVVGFMPIANADTSCEGVAYHSENSTGIFISQERATNCGCLFGMITEGTVTAVDLISFEAAGTADGVTLTWRTANEIDNLGFNLYRAESADGEKVKLNADLIPTNVAPGSPFGASYSYDDLSAEPGVTYFYWLEDVDFSGAATQHGPVEGARQ